MIGAKVTQINFYLCFCELLLAEGLLKLLSRYSEIGRGIYYSFPSYIGCEKAFSVLSIRFQTLKPEKIL